MVSKRMIRMVRLVAVCAVARVGAGQEADVTRVESPDGKVMVEFMMRGDVPAYRVSYGGKMVMLESKLGFLPGMAGGFSMGAVDQSQHVSGWTNRLGERSAVPDSYGEVQVGMRHTSGKELKVTFRAYDEGAALRYTFVGGAESLKATEEVTEFRLPEGTMGWEEHSTEGDYQRVKVSEMQPQIERPLTVELPGGVWGSLLEAGNVGYARMLLSPEAGSPGALVTHLGGTTLNTVGRAGVGKVGERMKGDDGSVVLKAGESTPWRVMVLGGKPGDLLERNYLVLNLNAPSVIGDASWIKPGKVMRSTVLTTANGKAIVDLGKELGLDYVMYDANWYGTDQTSDATVIRQPNLDLKEVAAYAHAHGMGAGLYVDARQVKKQRDVLFPLFRNEWRMDLVKIGFVPVGPQEEMKWLTETIEKAAEHKLMVNIHDGYRQTGNGRTYPNLMTVEGIQGNEHMPTPEHNCTLPFTRFVLGAGDYTVCYMDKRIKTTHAHQLAMGVVTFSPLQWLYWYDKPEQYAAAAGGVPPEMEFWRKMPTVWDETRVVNGAIGEYATIARRSGEAWFVGTINNSAARELEVPLGFLQGGRKYRAHVYSDDEKVGTRTKVGMSVQEVDRAMTLKVLLKPAGGQAIWIEPIGG